MAASPPTAEQLLTCLQKTPCSKRMNWGAFCEKMQQLNHSSPVVLDAIVVFTEEFMGGSLASRAYHVTSASPFWNSFDPNEKLIGSALDGKDENVDILTEYILEETPPPIFFCLIVFTLNGSPTPRPVPETTPPVLQECNDRLRGLFESGQVSDADVDKLRTVDGTRELFGPLYERSLITFSTRKVFKEEGSPYSKTPILLGNGNCYLFSSWSESDIPTIKRFLAKYAKGNGPDSPEPVAPIQSLLPLERSFRPIETEYINWLCETREIDRSTAEEYVEIARFVESASSKFGLAPGPFVSAPDYATAKGTLDALRNSIEFKTELNNQFQDRNIVDARLFLTFLKERQT